MNIFSTALCAGDGQFHTNEPDKDKPDKKLTVYKTVSLNEIREKVDNPPVYRKSQAPWIVPSTLLSRNFNCQEKNGVFLILWADLDSKPLPINQVAKHLVSIIGQCQFEIYTSKSATKDNQKSRILIFLNSGINGYDWKLCQEVLNDQLKALGIEPDRASERTAQLCYLPNRGEFYDSKSNRTGELFNPLQAFSEVITEKKLAITVAEQETQARRQASEKRRTELSFTGGNQNNLINVFNDAYTLEDILIQAGYQQKGHTFCHPNSSSGSYACSVKNGRAHSLNGSDPLNTGQGAHDAFSAFCILFHEGQNRQALQDAGNNWIKVNGISWNKVKQREYRQQQSEHKKTSTLPETKSITKPNVQAVSQPLSIIKQKTLANLIAKIIPVDYIQVCKELGWIRGANPDGTPKSPAQKHYKVSIIHQLLKLAKANQWHLVRDSGLSYIYTGCMWISLDKDELKNLLKEVAIAQGYPEIEARDSRFIHLLYEQALQDGFFSDKHFEKQSMINLSNCTLVLNSQGVKVKDFDYRDFLTHQLPFDYKPKARNLIFLNYLDEVLPDKATQRTLQEVCGYLFIKDLKLEKIFFLYGTGANGKSVLFEVINGLIGAENICHYSLESLTDDTGYFRAKIKDKIVNYGTDIKLTRIDAGMFKTLASGEPIEARLPYAEPFTMTDYAKLIFNVNRLDNANIEHTHGFYRRILIIPFNKTIADQDQDKSLHKKILADKAGVLNWIIEGAERVINQEDILVSKECSDFKARFIKETDSVAMFLDDSGYEACEFSRTLLSELYSEYKEFCLEDGYRAVGKTNFSKRLTALGYQRIKAEGNKDYFRLKPMYKS